MKRVEINIHGKVQGVGFRAWTRRNAQKIGVKGYVKNLRDGSVEIVAEGSERDLKRFERECRRGPLTAQVREVNVEYKEAKGEFERFLMEF